MNAVLSMSQAKQITGGRTPLVPVEYEAAVNALQACVTLDEAKYWSDKSDALAAWARIYHNDKASVEARRLKLHAHRRMGILSSELRPRVNKLSVNKTYAGSSPGPVSLLMERGLSKTQATSSRKLARLPEEDFTALVQQPRPPSPYTFGSHNRISKSEAWNTFTTAPFSFRSYCRRHDAAELARGMTDDEAKKASEIAVEISEWIDEFDQALQSRLKSKK